MAALRVGIVDTGVNAWHSHVRGRVGGCRIFLAEGGGIEEDNDFRDPVGHGTAVAGVLREALPDAWLFAVRVFDEGALTYPSLVARGILRAASQGCEFVNLSLAVRPGLGNDVVAAACAAALDAGCTLVASSPPDDRPWLPASLPGVCVVTADDTLEAGEVRALGPTRFAAAGRPRDLATFPRWVNLAGHSFACARGLAYLARLRSATPEARVRSDC
jgi:subtilisin family serine protease